jgi:nitroreductase
MAGEGQSALPAVQTLLTRRSVAALKLRGPGPDAEQITIAVEAALRAPDHNNLKPWHCVLIRGEARKKLSALLFERMQLREPSTPPQKLDKVRNNPLAAPLVIAIAARLHTGNKVPEQEQLLTCGAATMNMQNVFHAQGFASIWLTGGNVYDPLVAQALGIDTRQRLLGFLYVGSAGPPDSLLPPARPSDHMREWHG